MTRTSCDVDELRYLDMVKHSLGSVPRLLDIGFNRGDFTEEWLARFPDSEVFGFEPIPQIFDIAVETFKDAHRVHIYNYGLDVEAGIRKFYYILNDFDGMSGLHYRSAVYPQFIYKEIEVSIKIFDEIRHDFPAVDFVKIDTEGSELGVLKGMELYLSETKPKYIQFEYGEAYQDSNITLKEVIEFLERKGYKVMNGDLKIVSIENLIEDYVMQNFLAVLW